MTDVVRLRLNRWKQKLIDQTLRNPLLNFRPNKTTTIRIIDAQPTDIFRVLQLEGKPITFRSAADKVAASPQEDQSNFSTLNENPTQQRLKASELQTELDKDTLDLNLLRIYQKATSLFDEQGFSSLCMSIGMLEWCDRENGEASLKAPLILLPVQLVRETARSKFTLVATQDDPVLNPAILEKVRASSRVFLPPLPDNYEEFEPHTYFDEIRDVIIGQKNWKVTEETNLGFFAFLKFVMYKDLEAAEDTYARHHLIRSLCSSKAEFLDRVDEDDKVENLDEVLRPETTFQVVDADSSQQQAILAAKQGKNLVIEGPPGTGKSQTITNLIAESLADGKTVLFVSEKMAALEVVYNRLESAGLKDFCLQLHSNRTSKKSVYEELQRVLDSARPVDHKEDSELSRLGHLKSYLNGYTQALHEPFGLLNLSPYEVIGELCQLEGVPSVNANLPGLSEIDRHGFEQHSRNLAHHTQLVNELDSFAQHPWQHSELVTLTAKEEDNLQEAVGRLKTLAEKLKARCEKFAEEIGATRALTVAQAETLCEIAEALTQSPGAGQSFLMTDKWNSLSSDIVELLVRGVRYEQLSRSISALFKQQLLGEDFEDNLVKFRDNSKLVFRFVIPEFWKQRRYFRDFRKPGYRPKSNDEFIDDLEKALQCREDMLFILKKDQRGREAFGDKWQGLDSNWVELRIFAEWLVTIRGFIVEELLGPKGILLAAKGRVDAEPILTSISEVRQLIDDLKEQAALVCDLGRFDSLRAAYLVPQVEIEVLADWASNLSNNIRKVHELIALNQSKESCSNGLTGPFFLRFCEQGFDVQFLEAAFRRCFLRHWLDLCYSERPVLAKFQPTRHEQIIREFRILDDKVIELAKQRLRHNLCRTRDKQLNSSELQEELLILQKQIRARSKLPLRKLFKHVPNVIKSIKPCFMMSPLSVAQFVDSTSEPFDLVIFDEASQITSEDAVGSIVRGRQLAVVGDTKQLPPTNFFATQLADEGATGATADERDELQIVDLSSVLDNCLASRFTVRRLKWHYRSRHESLIAFSNSEFYKGDLFTFPGPDTGVADRGLSFQHVKGVYQGSGINPVEAQAVADAVCQHIKEFPELTLGVGTFNVKQQTLIRDELDKRRRDDPSLEFFFAKKGEGEFFVKNLENIQGDDRDVIFLSITYGPGQDGQVRHNFGPINGENGWRRLNVILTRAKLRLKVFSSMKAEDIEPARASSVGASHLRAFLRFAEGGVLNASHVGYRALIESPFERAVHDELTKVGLRLVPQVGQAGYKIDFGVLHDELPGRYLAGIECDGATYYSAATARDRDRLRYKVLEGLGWKLIRIWSTDWYHNKEAQIKRVLEFLSEQEKNVDQEDFAVPQAEQSMGIRPGDSATHKESRLTDLQAVNSDNQREPLEAGRAKRQLVPYTMTPVEVLGGIAAFDHAADQSISAVIKSVIEHEAPIHVEELKRRVSGHWQASRISPRISKRLDSLLETLVRKRDAVLRGDFVWKPLQTKVPARARKIKGYIFAAESVCAEELDEFIRYVLENGEQMSKEQLVAAVAKAIGFARAGQQISERILPRIQYLLEQSVLEPCSAGVRLVTSPGDTLEVPYQKAPTPNQFTT
jgi:superfamily I DNA and/or RNA helicase/very-short-patch-repair endonuclease